MHPIPSSKSPAILHRGQAASLSKPVQPDVDWASATPVLPGHICLCSRQALLHNGYMTGHLQDTRGCTLRIERLWQKHDSRLLNRSILLLDQQQTCHVVAQLRVFLQTFSPVLKRQLIESNLPFGQILNCAGIRPYFKQRQYFTLPHVLPTLDITPYRKCCQRFFGRFHEIIDQYGQPLAAVYEVLP